MPKFDISKFAEELAVPESGTTREQIVYLPLEKLKRDEKNFYHLDGIDELAGNIELIGLQQPLRVRADGESYVIVSGHRRCAALRKLAAEGKEQFREAACIIEADAGSEAMRELRLIYANAATRTLSGADLAKQAERVTALLYQLQEEGVEFPGRMRDHVAEACRVSKSKLGRLSFIREHLSADLAYLWEKDKLPEATAYELAHFPDALQQRIARLFQGGKGMPTADKLARFLQEEAAKLDYAPSFTCPGGNPCTHGDAFLRHDLTAGPWEELCRGETCCLSCPQAFREWGTCDRMCAAAKARRAEKNAKAKAKAADRQRRENEASLRELRLTCARMVRAADAAGLADYVRAQDGYSGTDGHTIGLLRRYARGEFKPDEKPSFFSFQLNRCPTLAKCAQTLHCSTDYLLGLTDELHPAPRAEIPENRVPVAFVDGREKPPRAGEYWCRMNCGGTDIYQSARWDAVLARWEFLNGVQIDAECLGWYPLPPRVKKEDEA